MYYQLKVNEIGDLGKIRKQVGRKTISTRRGKDFN